MALVDEAFMVDALADAILDALADDVHLADVQLFIRGGTPMPVPQDQHPYVEALVGEDVLGDELTGGVSRLTYRGLITASAQLAQSAADWLEPLDGDARRARVPSYDLIKRLMMLMQVELQRAEYADLNGLITTMEIGEQTVREAVTAFRLDGSIVYGLDDRTNNYENFGSIGFVVETERTVE